MYLPVDNIIAPIPNVNVMLCADKIQNYKDFYYITKILTQELKN